MKFLVAQDGRMHHRLHPKLRRMPEEQDSTTPPLWTDFTPEASLCSLAINRYGLHHGATPVGGMRPVMGGHRPVHENGALPPPGKKQKNGQGSSHYFRTRNLEAPWTSDRHRVRSGLQVHLRNMEGISPAVQHPPPNVDSLPPTD